MADHVQETAAEVAALIPKYSWELMDEEQRDDLMEKVVLPRYMKTTSDEVQMGPKFWAVLVGATPMAVKKRIHRLQKGEISADGTGSAAPKISRAKRAIKQVLREEPEAIDEVVLDLTEEQKQKLVLAADAGKRDVHEKVERNKARLDKEKRQRHTAQYISADGWLSRAKQEIRKATEEARNVEFSAEEQELLEERIAEIRRELGVAELAIAHSTEVDWDAEFAKLS